MDPSHVALIDISWPNSAFEKYECDSDIKFGVRIDEMIDLVFSAKTSGSDDLKAIISAISTLVEEATFVANAEGITFRGMDPSHVALIDISWPSMAAFYAAIKLCGRFICTSCL